MKEKKRGKPIFIGISSHNCPKCGFKLNRFGHGESWEPRKNQPYYFTYWDKCKKCNYIKLYEQAKVFVENQQSQMVIWGDSWENV